MIVHQAKTDDLNRMVRPQAAKTERYPVHPGDEFFRGSEEGIVLQALRGEMVEVSCFHVFWKKVYKSTVEEGGKRGVTKNVVIFFRFQKAESTIPCTEIG
jgi:hypothetical protein